MSTGAIVVLIIAVVVVLALAAFLARLELRRRHLRGRFGPEYDRLREDRPGRKAAEQELTERERRHAELGIQPISAMSRDRHTQHWSLIQATFVDQPTKAVDEADRLVVTIMEERGYPRAPFDERLAMLSVEHGAMLDHYRTGHDIRARHRDTQLSTEDLRTAMVHYRTLIEDLLEARPQSIRPKLSDRKPAAVTGLPPATPAGHNGDFLDDHRETRPEPEDTRSRRIIESPSLADTSRRPEAPPQLRQPDPEPAMRPDDESRIRPEAETHRA